MRYLRKQSAVSRIRLALDMSPLLNVCLMHVFCTCCSAGVTSATQPAGKNKVLLCARFEGEDLCRWTKLAVDDTWVELAREPRGKTTDTNNASCLRLTVAKISKRNGIRHTASITLQKHSWYQLKFSAYAAPRQLGRGYALTVSLESPDGKHVLARTTIPEVGGDWNEYSVALHTRDSYPGAVLVITMCEPGTVWLDDIRLLERGSDAAADQTP